MHCKNCNTQLNTNSRYCSLCGNKVTSKRLTVKNVVSDFSNQFFDYDNKIFKTFIHLFTKPEVVIEKFITGARKTYVNVISYLAVSLSLIGFQFLILRKFYPETMQASSSAAGVNAEIEREAARYMEYFFDYFSLISIIFIPIIAICTYIVFINKKHNYAEHMVINMYTSAQYTILMSLFGFAFMLLGLETNIGYAITAVLTYLYLGYCFKRIYKLTIFGAIWRTIVFQLLYMMFTGVIITIIVVSGIIIYKFIN